jgi:hypothetical protein
MIESQNSASDYGLNTSENESPASLEQTSAASVAFYLQLSDILNQNAKQYAEWKIKKLDPTERTEDSLQDIQQRAQFVMERLYLAKDEEGKEEFLEDWGDNEDALVSIVRNLAPDLDKMNEDLLQHAPELSKFDRLRITLNATKHLVSLPSEGRIYMLEQAGYTPEELKKIGKRLIASTGLTVATGVVGVSAVAVASEMAATHPYLNDISDPTTQLAVAGSFVLEHAVSIGASYQYLKLTKNERIQVSPSVYETYAYLLLKKILPDHPKIRDAASMFAYFIPMLPQDAFFISAAAAGDIGASVTTSQYIANTVVAGLSLIGAAVWNKRMK